jgi:hypothetical protein
LSIESAAFDTDQELGSATYYFSINGGKMPLQ